MNEEDKAVEHVKIPLPRRRMCMLSAVVFFVGYGYAINDGFGVPVLLVAGVGEQYAPFVLGISAIINLFLGGFLGSLSDRCTSPLGRRRPFIIGLMTLLLIAAIFYPYGIVLSDAFQLKRDSRTVYLIAHTAICVVTFDVCMDMTNTLDRSYLCDSITSKQTLHGNAIFTLMTSAGSFFGALLSALNWETIFHLLSGGQTKIVFATVIVVLLVCILLTINSVKEPKIGKDGKLDTMYNSKWTRYFTFCNYFAFDIYNRHEETAMNELSLEENQSMTYDNSFEHELNETEASPQSQNTIQQNKNATNLCICCNFITETFYMRIYNLFHFIKSLSTATIFLWLTQVLEWMTMLSLLFFLTHFVGTVVYDGSPDADHNMKDRKDYDKGVRMGFLCQSIGFGSSLLFSLFLYSKYSSKIKSRKAYVSIHVVTFLATGLLIFNKNIYLVASLHVIFGFFYSWIQIVPFIFLQNYKVSFLFS